LSVSGPDELLAGRREQTAVIENVGTPTEENR
jgi:hypothetical protein